MKRIGNFIFLAFFVMGWVTNLCAQNIQINADTSAKKIYVYDKFQYVVELKADLRSLPEMQLPDFSGFKVIGNPTSSSQFQIINGRVSKSEQLQMTLQATQQGKFTIAPSMVMYKGKAYRSNPVIIHVVAMDDKVSIKDEGAPDIPRDRIDDLFVWATVNSTKSFVGEQIEVEFTLYTRKKVRNYGIANVPDFTGFWSEQMPLIRNPNVENIRLNGVPFVQAKIAVMNLYPTVSGDLIVDPVEFKFEVENAGNDPFDDFFNSPFSRRHSIFRNLASENAASQAITISVKPVPLQGKPADFTGAVGQFELISNVENTQVQAGEAVVVKVTLAGKHGLKTLPAPELPQIENFKQFDPKSGDVEPYPGKLGWNRKTYELIFVPHKDGSYQIPSITYNYFNPETEKYHQLQTESYRIDVTPAPQNQSRSYRSTGSSDEMTLIGEDIRYIKTGVIIVNFNPLFNQIWFHGIFYVPVIVIPIALFYRRHLQKILGDELYARSIRAKTESMKSLKAAQIEYDKHNYALTLDHVAATFRQYLADRLRQSPAGLTSHQLAAELKIRKIDDSLESEIMEFWNQLEMLRYAPGDPEKDDIEGLIKKTRRLIDDMEKTKFKKSRMGKGHRQ